MRSILVREAVEPDEPNHDRAEAEDQERSDQNQHRWSVDLGDGHALLGRQTQDSRLPLTVMGRHCIVRTCVHEHRPTQSPPLLDELERTVR